MTFASRELKGQDLQEERRFTYRWSWGIDISQTGGNIERLHGKYNAATTPQDQEAARKGTATARDQGTSSRHTDDDDGDMAAASPALVSRAILVRLLAVACVGSDEGRRWSELERGKEKVECGGTLRHGDDEGEANDFVQSY